MSDLIKKEQYKEHTISIYPDNDSESPRDGDNLGTMLCLHSRYNLGDKHDLNRAAILRIVKGKDVVVVPLYLYDHSGLTMQTTPFECPWDSGLVGYIYTTKANIRNEYDCQRVSAKRVEEVQKCLRTEVETYNLFLMGSVYGYEVTDKEGDHIDSCWGFITADIDEVIQQGKDVLDYNFDELPR